MKEIGLSEVTVTQSDGSSRALSKEALLKEIAAQADARAFLEGHLEASFFKQIDDKIQSSEPKSFEGVTEFTESGGAVLFPVDLKITDNGSVVMQFAPSEDLLALREELVEAGGIAKAGLGKVTASTIAYLPNYAKCTKEQQRELDRSIRELNQKMLDEHLRVRLKDISVVSFKVNSLASRAIKAISLEEALLLGLESRVTYLS